jgi:iron(III) transport system ATP-binding protein
MQQNSSSESTQARDATEPRVIVRNVTKAFETRRGRHVALDNVSIDVAAGEALVLLGPSGCGKTTLLRCVAGLERPDSGEIIVHGKTVFSSERGIYLPPEERRLSMVFQSYALWPHMTVAANIAYPLENIGVGKTDVKAKVATVLDLVGLGSYEAAYPGQLSGGQQQRVALARAVVANEGVVLFDEPLSNLDAKVRERLRLELLTMQRKIGFSSLYVTHDQVEAMALADRIAVMAVGRIAQLGEGDDIYRQPVSRYVANFVGKSNEVSGIVRGKEGSYTVVETAVGMFLGVAAADARQPGQKVVVLFRPESLVPGSGFSSNRMDATLKHAMFLGSHLECVVDVGDTSLLLTMSGDHPAIEGTKLDLAVDPDRVQIFAEGEAADGG